MADTFTLSGACTIVPTSSNDSGDPSVTAALDETLSIKKKQVVSIELTDDNAKSVELGDLAAVHALVLRARGGKVRVRLTSTDGSLQAIAVDALAIIISAAVGYTAIDLTRVVGSGTTVTIKGILGEKA